MAITAVITPAPDPPEYIQSLSHEQRITAEKALKRKIDTRLMPTIVLMFILNYLDRNNISSAKLAGLPEDLKLKGSQYQSMLTMSFQVAVSIFFFGYLLMQVPSNLFLNKIGKPAVYLPSCMIIWGLISLATAATRNFVGLTICRFMLGFVEAAFFPGCMFHLSCWYTRKELAFRTAIFFSGILISGSISGMVTAGIKANLDGLHGLRAWRWLFIIEGSTTVGLALLGTIILPNFPSTTSWLNAEEKQLAIWRLIEDVGQKDWSEDDQLSFADGLRLAFTDYKVYILLFICYGIIASASVTNFFPAIVKTLKYSDVTTLFLTAPPYAVGLVMTLLNAWHADRVQERSFHIIVPLIFAVTSFIVSATTSSNALRYTAMIVMVPGIFSSCVIALAWVSDTISRPPIKRAVAISFINAVSNSSPVYSSYLYRDTSAPRYAAAMTFNSVMCSAAIVTVLVLRHILIRLNHQFDTKETSEEDKNCESTHGRKSFRYIT
ncbi:MFS transporter/pantothenate transporter liz1 [Blumeria hordei DH14]|uniref:MFS transporter/pantothenate transporter liz1 n=1 Tax=Blumeria graminis f. sp. hordei (strain DH14) TaxID=546991 RepID=N1JJ40_BLUG1|nr:MFS transporter/pantothenate transporter liz1 [Blumeria hordei DH14]